MLATNRNRLLFGAGVVVLVATVGIVIWGATRRPAAVAANAVPPADAVPDSREPIRVSTIRPKHQDNFAVSIQQLASVRAYFQAELKSRVAGVVRAVKINIGDVVKKGDLLVDIDVPDLLQDVAQKAATVEQRKQELRLSQAKVKSNQAWIDAAVAGVAQQKAAVIQASATADYRKKRLDRFRELLKRQAINEDLVDEQERDWAAAVGAAQIAVAGVQKAEADLIERRAGLETALVDVDLKKSQVDVAFHELERTKALAAYAKIHAPFDGVVLKCDVDPGDFVQNGSTGAGEPLVAMARVDVVTIVSKIPDNAAAFVSTKTPVEIQIDQLPGVLLKGRVTRYSPSIDASDRTMRVEVDIRNSAAPCLDDLSVCTKACLNANALPEGMREKSLVPGMNGYIRLQLDETAGSRLVPSNAVFSRGGKQYVMLAEDGKAKLVGVYIQVNDGKVAKITLLRPDSSGREIPVELTGREEIVASRQAELDDGQPILPNSKDW